jgi:hypothetical protein
MRSRQKLPLRWSLSAVTSGPGDIVSVPCRAEGVGHDAVYGLLMERLQDVCVHFVYFASLCIDDYVYNF